jgi:protocatechuate 3,4-dioxygenase beta subunit
MRRLFSLTLMCAVVIVASLAAQSGSEAPANAPSTGRLAPAGEPGIRLQINGVVVAADGTPVPGASIYAYQTDAEGYYGVKPASDSEHPRLKLLLRSGPKGEWSFETIRPGSYPNSKAPGHIHFEVRARGFAPKIFEIVFEGDPFITAEMRSNPAFSVRKIMPTSPGTVSERIVLSK